MLSILSCVWGFWVFFSFLKGHEDTYLLQLSSWKSSVFGIYFCNIFPRAFPECCWIWDRIFLIFQFSNAIKRKSKQRKVWYVLRELMNNYHILFSVLSLSIQLLVLSVVENWFTENWLRMTDLLACSFQNLPLLSVCKISVIFATL